MKRLLLIGLWIICGAISGSIKAADKPDEFSYQITGTATLANDEVIEVDMLIGFHESPQGWYFRAGPDSVFRDTPPSMYYLNLNLNKQGYAYVLEFSNEPLKRFNIKLDGHEIELMPARSFDIKHSLRLRIDDRQFLFDTRHPRIRLDLADKGLTGIVAEGILRDLSNHRAQ